MIYKDFPNIEKYGNILTCVFDSQQNPTQGTDKANKAKRE